MRKFLREVFTSALGTVVALSALSLMGVAVIAGIIVAIAGEEEGVELEENTVLVMDLSTQIRDLPVSLSWEDVVTNTIPNVIPLRQVLQSIEAATTDDRITAIFLDGRQGISPNGYATLQEVRSALAQFQAAGKKIIAYDVEYTEKEYFLSSLADEIIINPMGLLEMNGLSSQQLFLAGAFEKYGVGVQVVRAGNYKSAVEPLVRQDFSPENKEQLQALLGDLWGHFRATVASDRPLTANEIQTLTDGQGVMMPKAALDRQLVTKIQYLDEVIQELKTFTNAEEGEPFFPQISLEAYNGNRLLDEKWSDQDEEEQKIALVYAEGTIVGGEGDNETIGGDRLAQTLREIRQDEDVKALVLRINSPGGSATASEIIARELELINADKPVVISMGNVAASGGYWLAAAGDYIFAEKTTITGSIGVFGVLTNLQELGNNNGLSWDVVKTGKYADLANISRPLAGDELALFQDFVNQTYDLFLNKVAQARQLSRERVNELAQGRVWSGEDALAVGLVDEIGGLEAAIAKGAALGELGDNWAVEEYPEPRSFEEEILEDLLGARLAQTPNPDPLSAEFLTLQKTLKTWQNFNDPRQVYALLPWELAID